MKLLTSLKGMVIVCIILFPSFLIAGNQKKLNNGFVAEQGQFKTFENLKFFWQDEKVNIYFITDKLVFITEEVTYEDNEESLKAKAEGNDNLALKLSAKTTVYRFDLEFVNSNENVNVFGLNQMKHANDYYLGHCPDGILNVPSFGKIKYTDIYDNIDLVFYFNDTILKYEFIINEGGNPNDIKLNWEGVKDLNIVDNNVSFNIGSYSFTDLSPVSFNANGNEVKTNYVLKNGLISFDIDIEDSESIQILDPGIVWASSLEYNGYGSWGEVVANSKGDFYYVDWEWSPGGTEVTNYLADAGSSNTFGTDVTNNDIIISKFDQNGTLSWACKYGGSGDDDVNGGVAVDDNDDLYITGTTAKLFSSSTGNFPLQSWTGAFYQAWDGTLSTGTRGYLIKFLANNSRQWATYLDRGANLEVFDLECGPSNTMYMVGKSGSSPTRIKAGSIPTGSGYNGNLNGTSTATSFILQFNSSGALIWSTWLPGYTASTSTGRACDIAVDNSGNVYVAGDEMWSSTTRFSTSLISASYSNLGQSDLFYMKFSSTHSTVAAYGKYIGGAGFDKINVGAANGDIEADNSGNLYLVGHTYSANFPVTNPGGCAYYDGTINDGSGITANVASTQDGYLVKVSSSGSISYATFMGGTAYTSMKKIKCDADGNIWGCALQNYTGLSTISHTDYYNQTFLGTSGKVMFFQLRDDDYLEWLSYFGNSSGSYSYGGFDINEPSSDQVDLFIAGNFNSLSNVGAGYQFSSSSCTGAAKISNTKSIHEPDGITPTMADVCNVSQLTVDGSLPSGTSWAWYSGSCGGTAVGSGTTISVAPSTTTTYYVQAVGSCFVSNCTSYTVNIYNSAVAEGSWVGAYSTDWFDCRNWGEGRVPNSSISVTIPSGCTYYPNITTGSAACNYLYVNSGGSIIVNGGTLSVSGYFYKYSGGNATFTSGTCNVNYNYYNYGTSGETRVNGGTLNVGVATTSNEFINYNGKLYVTSGNLDCGRYLYNYNGYTSNYVNISGGTVYADNIPNYEGAIYQSGGTLTTGGYYREYDSGGGNYYGSGTAVINFNGSSNTYIRLMRSGTYFYNVNINGPYYIETGSTQILDVNGYFNIASGKSFDSNGRTMYVAGNWINSGTFTHDNNIVYFDGGSAIITTGGTAVGKKFYNLRVTGGTKTLSGYLDVDNDMYISGTFATGSNILYIGGDWDSSTGSVTSVSTSSSYPVYFDGSTSPVTIQASASTNHFGYLRFNKTSSTSTINMANSFRCYRCEPWKGTFNTNGYILTCSTYFLANYDNNDPADYDVYVNIGSGRINAPSGFQARQGSRVTMTSGNLDVGYFILYGGTTDAYFDMDGGNLWISQYFRTYDGIHFRGDGGSVIFDGTPASNRYLWVHLTAAECYFNNIGVSSNRYVDLYATDFGVLDANGNIFINTGGTLESNSKSIYCGGDWTNLGTFNCGTGLVTFDGSSNQNINAGGTASTKLFYDVTCTNSATITMLSNMSVNRNFNVNNGTFLINNYDLYTINATTGSATIASGAEVDLTGSSAYWRTANANNGNLTISGVLDLNDGKVTTGAGITLNSGGYIYQDGGSLGVGDNLTLNGTYHGDAGLLRGRSDSDNFAPNIIVNSTDVYVYNFFDDGGSDVNPTILNGAQPLVVNNDVAINSGYFNANGKTIILKGDWSDVNGTHTHNSSTVRFEGTSQQTVNSNSSFGNVLINNTGGILLSDDMTIDNSATFTSGIVNTNSNTVIFTSTANSNAGTSTSYIDGPAQRTGTGAFTFALGDYTTRDIGSGSQLYSIWAPIITNSGATSGTATIEYYFDNQDLNTWWYHDWTHESPLTHTTSREYWDVTSSADIAVSLYWKNNNPCEIHDFCTPSTTNFLDEYLTVAYWDGIWKDAGGTPIGDYQNGYITSSSTIPFAAKGSHQVTFGGKDSQIPLPVELTYFKANCIDGGALLEWQTMSEINNDYFVLEKSNGKDEFVEIARIDGAGNSHEPINYNYFDENLNNGDNYYRLKQVDYDGKESIFEIISLNCSENGINEPKMTVYPNPFIDELTVNIENINGDFIELQIFDELGKLILTQKYKLNSNSFKTVLQLDELKSAVYNLRCISNDVILNDKIIRK